MPIFGLSGEGNCYTTIEASDAGEALSEGGHLPRHAWEDDGKVRDIEVVSRDGQPLESDTRIHSLTFDIWMESEDTPIATASDLESTRLITRALEEIEPQMRFRFTPHSYTSPVFTMRDDEQSIIAELGAWGRTRNIPGAPKDGPWYA